MMVGFFLLFNYHIMNFETRLIIFHMSLVTDHLYELEGITLDLRALLQSLEIVFISLPIGIILIYLFRYK